MTKIFILFIVIFIVNFISKAQEITNIGKPINTIHYTEYAPTISSDGKTMIFESNQSGYWKLYETRKLSTGKWSEPEYIEEINDTDDENDFIGGPFLTYDGKNIFFTSDRKGGIGGVDIWYSKKEGNSWSEPINLNINSSGYDGFPSVSADGNTLYFMRNSKNPTVDDNNCYSIYISHLQKDGIWGVPELLPYPVNSGCDGWPRIMADNKTLIFSSKRNGNLNDFDLYITKLSKNNQWSTPKPLNIVNTSTDDKFVTIPTSKNIMYFTIEINDNEDIFSLPIPKKYKNDISLIPQQKVSQILFGTITDIETDEPINNASIIITNGKTNQLISSIKSNNNGEYTFLIRNIYILNLSISAKGYYYSSEDIDLTKINGKNNFEKNFKLEPLKLNTSFVLSITFDNDKYDIRPSAIPELNKVVSLLKENPDLIVEISAHTDALGSDKHNQELSDNRAKSVVDYLVSKGINKKRLIAKGYGAKFPKYPNDTEANMSKNRRVEFKIVEKQ